MPVRQLIVEKLFVLLLNSFLDAKETRGNAVGQICGKALGGQRVGYLGVGVALLLHSIDELVFEIEISIDASSDRCAATRDATLRRITVILRRCPFIGVRLWYSMLAYWAILVAILM